MVIRPMSEEDLDFAAACTRSEGWQSETREDFSVFLAHDPGGCFLAEEDGRAVGIAVATCYGAYGFVGELIVIPEKRGRGIGQRLLQEAIDYLQDRQVQNVLLDGVPAAISLYERLGFRKLCRSLRFSGRPRGQWHDGVRPMQVADLEAVCRLDLEAFGEDRVFFLKHRFALHPALCLVLEQDGRLAGYIMARRRPDLVAAGPWVLGPAAKEAEKLLEGLAVAAAGALVTLGVLENNAEAAGIVRALGFDERPSSPWRMAFGPLAELGASDRCYAVGSPAKG